MKTIKITSLLLCAGLVIVSGAHAESYSELLQSGDILLSQEEFDKCLEVYAEAEKEASSNTEKALAMSKQAYVLAYKKKDYKDALALADKALELKDVKPIGRVTALQVRGKYLMDKEEDYEAAEKVLKEAVSLDGVDWAKPVLYLTLGDCYRADGKFNLALEAYEKVPEISDSDDIYTISVAMLNIGMVYHYNLRKPDKALEAYNKAESLNPGLEREIKEHKSRL